ncbi:nectin-3-like protein [Engraulis encrasicolus]|uniref:nectin-3-like protein n=1 Tax=Engraulis encrasicolus TaxID=184585 RepID=UPI002FD731CD
MAAAGILRLALAIIWAVQAAATGIHNGDPGAPNHHPLVLRIGNNITPVADQQRASLATCSARGPQPPAKISWITPGTSFETLDVTESSGDQKGTVTSTSQLIAVASRELDRQEVRCVISHPMLEHDMVLSYTLQVHCPPNNVQFTVKEDGYECSANGNPTPTKYTWTRQGEPLPSAGVRAEGSRLYVPFTPEFNGLYSCEASNPYGSASRTLTLYAVNDGFWTDFPLWALIAVVTAVVVSVAITLLLLWQSVTVQGQQKTLKDLASKLLHRNTTSMSI